MRGLTGTGLVADDLYLLAHNDVTGRPFLQPRALGLGLAGALLAELALSGHLAVRSGSLDVVSAAPPGDGLARHILGLLLSEREPYAATGQNPMIRLFFDLGTTGGFGIMILLALTSVAVVAFFARHRDGETAWSARIAPAIAAVLLTGIVILAVRNYSTLLGVPPGDPASWAFPASYAAAAVIGLVWALVLRARRPGLYAAIGLGARAVTARLTPPGGPASR